MDRRHRTPSTFLHDAFPTTSLSKTSQAARLSMSRLRN